ncbi:MAG: acylneuraminate cytidylyltransferase family protein [Bacteroidia bacterium]|nr:acylneuraminate cytidylyltransferase family protein [Bacteroidia bacterium]MCO5254588.1 acylneuraminate cytidylyltransferase family protein [Bacteroidota bacterium]
MRILGVIPARGGSKGVPRKNIKLLGDKPLIAYTIEAALQSQLTKVIVSTDDEEIAEVSRQYGAEVPFMRPAELASDTASSIDVVLHTLTEVEDDMNDYEAVMLLQPTTPFRTYKDINECINKFNNSDSDSLISVREVPHEFNPHWVFEEKSIGFLSIATGEKEIIKRRQDLPRAYYRDGAIYMVNSMVLKEKKTLYGETISYWINKSQEFVNIDTMEDWVKAERIISSK